MVSVPGEASGEQAKRSWLELAPRCSYTNICGTAATEGIYIRNSSSERRWLRIFPMTYRDWGA